MKRRGEARHWKLTEEAMQLFLEQCALRTAILSYDELAARTGMTRNSARVTMWNMMRERRSGKARVHRGTAFDLSRTERMLAELMQSE